MLYFSGTSPADITSDRAGLHQLRLTLMKKLSKKELWSYQEEQFPSDERIRALNRC